MPVDSTATGLAAYVSGEMMVFGVACFLVATLVIFLDWALLATQGRSLLEISYGTNRIKVVALWSLAAGIVGLFSVALEILQPNLQAAVTVAVGWPMIMARLIESSTATIQAPTDEEVDE